MIILLLYTYDVVCTQHTSQRFSIRDGRSNIYLKHLEMPIAIIYIVKNDILYHAMKFSKYFDSFLGIYSICIIS